MLRDMTTGKIVEAEEKIESKNHKPESPSKETFKEHSFPVLVNSEESEAEDNEEIYIDINGVNCLVLGDFFMGEDEIIAVCPDFSEDSEENEIVFYHYDRNSETLSDIADEIFDDVAEAFAQIIGEDNGNIS